MPNGNDKWAQYAVPTTGGGGDKWAQYATTAPATPAGADAATEAAAEPWRKLTTGQGWLEQLKETPGAVWDMLKGTYGMGKDILSASPSEPFSYYNDVVRKYLTDPAKQEYTKSAQAGEQGRTAETIAHAAGAAIPFFGPMVTQMGEQVGRGDVLPTAAQAATAYVGGKLVKGAGEAIKRGARIPGAIAEGEGGGLQEGLRMRAESRARVYQQSLQGQLKQARALHQAEVEQSAQRLIQRDVADNAQRGGAGTIDKSAADTALDKVLHGSGPAEEGVGIQARQGTAKAMGELAAHPPKLTFEQAKNLRTVIGRIMSDTKLPADRAPVAAAYDSLTEQMKARGEELSPGDWKAYNEIHSKLHTMRDSWLDDAISADNPYTLRDLLKGNKWGIARQWIRETQQKFGPSISSQAFIEDLNALHKNVEWAPPREAGAGFSGVMRTIQKQPAVAGTAWAALQALGVPWVARLLGVWESGKAADIYQQLGEPKLTPAEVTGTPNRPGAGGSPLEQADVPGGETEMERLRRTGTGTREATPPTKEEVAGAEERKERAEAEERVDRQGIAGKLKKARKNRGKE